MPRDPECEIGVYSPADNSEALELERACAQGSSYRMSFRRQTFHRRAENFGDWRIFTARSNGRLAGVVAVAIKDAVLLGGETRAAFCFDLRVHPEFRGEGVGRRLAGAAKTWGLERASFSYTYVLADNGTSRRIAAGQGGSLVGGYSHLVYPVFPRRQHAPRANPASPAAFEEVHAAMRDTSRPFDFYANPCCEPGRGGYVESWMLRRGRDIAGCSAWSNQGILGEVIEAVPLPLRIAPHFLRTWPLRLASWPHIPTPGEELRSWYLFDCFATEPALARDLLRHVASEALDRGIDYCYLAHDPREEWVSAVRSDVPRLFSPSLSYHLLLHRERGTQAPLPRIYVDVRDL